MNKKKEVTNWAKPENRKHELAPKCVKSPYFCSVKMVPQEVVLFLTLERLKRGTETSSIYI